MAFQSGGTGAEFCLGTTGGVYLPNFGAAITGPPVTIACFVKLFNNTAKQAPGAGGVNTDSATCNSPDPLTRNLCYSVNPRGKDYLIIGIGATSNGRKLVLSYDTHPFTRVKYATEMRYRTRNVGNTIDDGCCCDYVDPFNSAVLTPNISETDCITSWAFEESISTRVPEYFGGVYPNNPTSGFNSQEIRDIICLQKCTSGIARPNSQKRFVLRYYDVSEKYDSVCNLGPADDYTRFKSSGDFFDRFANRNPTIGVSPCEPGTYSLGDGDCIGFGRGTFHSCWLRPNGSVGCTGINTINQCNVPTSLNAKALMKFGISHSLALYLRQDGQTGLTGWGSNSNDQLKFPNGITAIMAEGGMAHTVILRRNGGITAFGANIDQNGNQSNQCVLNSTLMAANAAKKVSAGLAFNMAILSGDGVTAWGDNTYGQCNVPAGLTAVEIACGGYHALALKHDGTVVAWGRGSGGCFGDCDCNQSVVPIGITYAAENGDPIVAIRASLCNSFAVTRSGAVIRWGGDCLTDVPYGPGGFYSEQLYGPCYADRFGELGMTLINGATLPEIFVVSNHNSTGKYIVPQDFSVGPNADWIYVAGTMDNDTDKTRRLHLVSTDSTNTVRSSPPSTTEFLSGHTLENPSNILLGNFMTNQYEWARSQTFMDGMMSEAAVWNAVLTTDELKMLANGVKPIYIRPDKLVFYSPMLNSNVIDYAGGRPLASYDSSGVPSGYNQTGYSSVTRTGLTFHTKRIG